jgi:alanine-glyoxylate transaminase/serine-glyoxylate transaminase/serine-pyruvate transaminase
LQGRKAVNRSWYFDIKLISDYLFVSHRYHHTASATLFYALHEGLTLIEEEGLEQRCERHRQAHHEFVKGISAMGLEMLIPAEYRIWNLNTPLVPEGVDEAKVRATLLKEHGIEIAGGFGPLAGKVFRIGLMGPLATRDHVHDFLTNFGDALRGAGYKG